jgi:hypothetical protein
LKHDVPDTFRSALCTQNAYLEDHRNTPLAGITIEQMKEIISWDMEERTPFEIISNLPGVTRVDTNARTHDLGRFNVSTTNATYLTNTKWIDAKLAAIFERTTPTDKLEGSDFPSPVRMGRRPGRRATKPKQNSAYTEHLTHNTPPQLAHPRPRNPTSGISNASLLPLTMTLITPPSFPHPPPPILLAPLLATIPFNPP